MFKTGKTNPRAPILFFITQNIQVCLSFHSLRDDFKWDDSYTPLSSNPVSSLIKLLIKMHMKILDCDVFWGDLFPEYISTHQPPFPSHFVLHLL